MYLLKKNSCFINLHLIYPYIDSYVYHIIITIYDNPIGEM